MLQSDYQRLMYTKNLSSLKTGETSTPILGQLREELRSGLYMIYKWVVSRVEETNSEIPNGTILEINYNL